MILPVVLLATTLARTSIVVTDFGAKPDSGQDATVPFQKALAAAEAAKSPVTLVIPKGRYDFFSPLATRRKCFYSNATESDSDGTRTIAIDLRGIDHLTIEGNDSRLVMRGFMTMLVAEHCHDLRLQNLEFDFARPSVSEITAVEKGDGYWIGRVHPDSTYRIVDRRIQWYGEDWSAYHNLTQHFDPIAKTVLRGGDPTENATAIIDMSERRLRFEVPKDSLDQAVVGQTYQFRNTTRSETGMWFSRCRDVFMESVRIRAMAGFGALFQYTENVDLHKILVAPSPESGRTCASAADILHFSGCRGKIRVSESYLSAAHDDAINIHGTHLVVVAQPGERKIRVRFVHSQTWGFAAFQPGDEIEFVKPDTLQSFGKAKVTAFAMTDNPREQLLTLDRPLPKGVKFGTDAVENVTWTPTVEITQNVITLVPTRGILVTTRQPVRIERNKFDRIPMPAILVEDDAAGWFESGPVHYMLISRNLFEEGGGYAIQFNPQNKVDDGPVHRNIRIENNAFHLRQVPAISLKSVDHVSLLGNSFEMKMKSVSPSDAVTATQSKNVKAQP